MQGSLTYMSTKVSCADADDKVRLTDCLNAPYLHDSNL